jgi:uncharacterized protein YgiM (DUF1202 family)
VRTLLTLLAALAAAPGYAAAAYVSDDLVLGVYSEENSQGSRLATLHSGMRVETLATSGEYSQVRLSDGRIGWVKSSYLMSSEPAAARVKRLEEELSRFRATTPALAEAAAHSEVERLQQALADKDAQLQSALAAGAAKASPGAPQPAAIPPLHSSLMQRLWLAAAAAVPALLVGFWIGYATLARRVRQKFGGIKVY